MSTTLGLAGGPRVGAGPASWGGRRDRWFFTGMAAAAALTVFAGFARSYYLGAFLGAPPLSTLVHLHGLLFTLWILLFLTQTSLIAVRRTDLHRRTGAAGGVLAALMVVVGFMTAVGAAKRGLSPPGAPPPLVFLAIPLGALLAFAVLLVAGLYSRRRSETHKRLMLLATIALLTPAIARMPLIGAGGPPAALGVTSLFVAACLVYDRAAHGRVHPAFLWGGVFLILSMPLRFMVGGTDAWLSFARWLTH